jgi:ComF family protein
MNSQISLKRDYIRNPAYVFYHIFWQSIDWIFPPFCIGCGKMGERLCQTCRLNIIRINGAICSICGDVIWKGGLCRSCQEKRPSYEKLTSYGLHEGILRDCVHRLKYQNDIGLGEVLAELIANSVLLEGIQIDLIAPVPLSKKRLEERGYNQAAIIAYPLALILKKEYLSKGLQRIRETRSQVELNRLERTSNVTDAFECNNTSISGKTVLLVDDVITTGSTMEACSQALIRAGARQVVGWSVTRAIYQNDSK